MSCLLHCWYCWHIYQWKWSSRNTSWRGIKPATVYMCMWICLKMGDSLSIWIKIAILMKTMMIKHQVWSPYFQGHSCYYILVLVHLDVTLQMPIEMYRVIYHHLGALVKGLRAVHHHPSSSIGNKIWNEIHGLLTLWGLRAWLSQVRCIDFISHMFVAFLLVQHASHVKQFAASKCQAVLPQAALLVRHCSRLHCSPQRGRFPGETRLLWTLFHQGQCGRRRHRTGGVFTTRNCRKSTTVENGNVEDWNRRNG